MTPEALAAIGELISRYGLPLVILGVFLYLILSGRLVTGTQLKTMQALYEREREDRLAAQTNMAKFAQANVDLGESVSDLVSTFTKPDPYIERLHGARAKR